MLSELFENLPPADKVTTNPAKLADVRRLFKFLNPDDILWFENVFRVNNENENVCISEETQENNVTLDG